MIAHAFLWKMWKRLSLVDIDLMVAHALVVTNLETVAWIHFAAEKASIPWRNLSYPSQRKYITLNGKQHSKCVTTFFTLYIPCQNLDTKPVRHTHNPGSSRYSCTAWPSFIPSNAPKKKTLILSLLTISLVKCKLQGVSSDLWQLWLWISDESIWFTSVIVLFVP